MKTRQCTGSDTFLGYQVQPREKIRIQDDFSNINIFLRKKSDKAHHALSTNESTHFQN